MCYNIAYVTFKCYYNIASLLIQALHVAFKHKYNIHECMLNSFANLILVQDLLVVGETGKILSVV
jgi:hypothetical protein